MKPRPFDYVQPDTAEEAMALLAEYGDDARVLAGGQSLVPMLNLRLIDPQVLIDISRIKELDTIRDRGDVIEVGAAVTQNQLLAWPTLKQKLPLVAAALPYVGHFQTRNRGTVCGSIAHADPSSELPLALAVCDGDVVLRSARGERVLPAGEFQQDMLTTAREADELVAAVRFPVMTGHGAGFHEVARRHGDFAIIAVAAMVEKDNSIRVGVGGMAGRPMVRVRQRQCGAMRISKWAEELEGYEDLHASTALRRDLFKKLGPHVIAQATGGKAVMRRVNRNEKTRVTLTLNGKTLSADAEPRMLLTDFLRHALGATGTHVGCEHGICGACTVLIDGVAQRACLTLAVQAQGRAVTTVEALADADGTLNPLQQAFRNNHALQCGFCTPGILMSFTDYLKRNPHPTTDEIREVLSGHICRCTGYAGIVKAVEEVAKSP